MTYQGAASAQASSVVLPAHQAGDLLHIVVNEGTMIPAADATVPNWVLIDQGTATAAITSAYAIATHSAHTSGVWTGATGCIVIVLRPTDGRRATFVIGSNTTNVATNFIYPLSNVPGAGSPVLPASPYWCVRCASASAGSTAQNPPTGYTMRGRVPAATAAFLGMHTKNTLVSVTETAATVTATPAVGNRAQTNMFGDLPIPKLTGLI